LIVGSEGELLIATMVGGITLAGSLSNDQILAG
jgi:hypothetical protein